MAIMNYEKLEVYKKAYQMVLDIYKVTSDFPKKEEYGITSQIRRAACSVIANIVEGSSRNTYQELKNFLYISRGSNEEVRVFIKISKDLNYANEGESEKLISNTEEIGRMLNGMINKIKNKIKDTKKEK